MQNVVLIVHVKYAFAALTANAEQVNKKLGAKASFFMFEVRCLWQLFDSWFIVICSLFIFSISTFSYYHILLWLSF